MSTRAIIYGTIAIDTLITPGGRANSVLGGSGPYAALAARLLTDRADMVGVVGDDFPDEFSQALEVRGVGMQHVDRAKGKTFAWTGEYEDDMNNRRSVSTLEGVQETWQMNLPQELRESELAVACNVTPRLQLRLLEQCSGAKFTMADFMESWILRERAYVDALLARVDMALMNDSEARVFAGTDDSIEAGHVLLAAGPRYAVVKHGSAGATLFHKAEDGGDPQIFRCPAWPLIHPQDPTGAGDSFMGAFAGYLTTCLNGGNPAWEDMKRAMAIATVVAAAVCEKFGTVSLFALTRQELAHRLSQFHEMTTWE